ncbi:MAG: CsgG/HfaB family protein [Bacteroidales bacterium]|nr:CsgG/HfaB family protein [Bacteroidales bacterium]MCF6341877.1 CsgG/HfaB family protein [Bacteroidales bacterium]
MIKSLRFSILIFLLLFILSPFLKAQKIECFILEAPEKPFYDVHKIGVLKFNCTNNRRKDVVLTDYIVANLLDQKRGIENKGRSLYGLVKAKEGKTYVKGVKTDFYEVIERDQLEKIMKEQKLSLSGALDESSAAEVGRILGLDVIVLGNVSYTHTDERSNSELTGSCLKRTVTAKGTMKLISVETAQVVGTIASSAGFKDSGCGDKMSSVMSVDQLADVALNQLAKNFVDYFSPGFTYIKYEMEKVKLKAFKSKGKEAMDFLKNGDVDRAFPIVYAMFEADSYNPKTAYNLGVLYEMVGAYEDAFEYYGMAYELDYTNKKFQEATERAEKGVALAQYLEDIGRPIQAYSFTGDGVAGALAERVTIKGSSSDRTNVYELPNKASPVVAKVPGGLEFKVIKEHSKFYEIQLRGSKVGFLAKSDAK